MVYLPIIQNIGLLLSLTIVQSLLIRRFSKQSLPYHCLSGLVFGAIGVIGMMTPVRLLPGVIFDGRSIILAVAGLFGGPVTALISAIMCGAYRYWLGGNGALMGLCVITESAGFGVLFHYLRLRYPRVVRPVGLLTLGFLVHATMVGFMATLPGTLSREAFHQIGLAVISVYPLATFLACLLFLQTEAQVAGEAALRESLARARALLNNPGSIALLLDKAGCIWDGNQKVSELFGHSMETLRGRTLESVLPSAPGGSWRARFETVLKLSQPTTFETELNDHWYDLALTPILNDQGEPLGVSIMAWDITQRKRAEQVLRESENRFRTLFDCAREAMVTLAAPSWRFTSGNPAAVVLFASGDETRFKTLHPWDVSPEFQPDGRHSAEKALEILNAALREGSFFCHWSHRRLNGQEFPATVLLARVEMDGRPTLMATIRDITEQARLEDQLRHSQKMEAVGQLAGGVAHDFNNILAATMMQLGMLRQNPHLDARTQQAVCELEAGTKRAAGLTRQLLMFSRRSMLEVKVLDVNDLVSNLLKMLRRLIGEHIDLQFQGKAGLPAVEADAGMLEQVLMNLAVNARDAMPKGGRLTIATQVRQISEEDARHDPDMKSGRFVCLVVSDTGCGMDEPTLKRIFEPFFTTKEMGKGTGLGLATVYGIVAQHQGWIKVRSTLGQGSVFEVFLPASDKQVAEPIAAGPPPQILRGQETILLVEDEASLRQTVGRTLQSFGYRVYEAANGREALALWQQHGQHIDLLFTDMVMPDGMNGLELAEELRRSRPGLKIIITSGYSSEIADQGVKLESGIAYLPKPYQSVELGKLLRECLEQP